MGVPEQSFTKVCTVIKTRDWLDTLDVSWFLMVLKRNERVKIKGKREVYLVNPVF